MPSWLARGGIGAHQAEDPVGILRQRRPDLAAIDDIIVAVAPACVLSRQDRSRRRARRNPDTTSRRDWQTPGRNRRFCASLPNAISTGPSMLTSNPCGSGVGAAASRREQIMLDRPPAGAAPLLRPVRHRPAFGIEDALPGDHVLFAQPAALDHFVADRGRQVVLQEGTHVGAECVLFRREAKVHYVLLIRSFRLICRSSPRRRGPSLSRLRGNDRQINLELWNNVY